MKRKKPSLSLEKVKHVAYLADLTLSPKELKKFQKQLSEILAYVGQLDELKTERVEPTSQVTGLENVFRGDETTPSLTQEEVLLGAKNSDRGFFKIKGIFDKNEA